MVSWKTNTNGLWMVQLCLLSFSEIGPTKAAHLIHYTHVCILRMIEYVCEDLCFYVSLILWWKKTQQGVSSKKKRGGGNVAGERRRARLLQWEVYSLGTVAVYSFHRVKNFSTLSSCTWNSLPLFIHQCGISLTWVEMLDMPSITCCCLEKIVYAWMCLHKAMLG